MSTVEAFRYTLTVEGTRTQRIVAFVGDGKRTYKYHDAAGNLVILSEPSARRLIDTWRMLSLSDPSWFALEFEGIDGVKLPDPPRLTIHGALAMIGAGAEARREEVADSAWNLTDLGQWAIDRAEALRRAKQIAEYMVRTGQWAAPGTVFFGPYDTSGIRRNRAGQIVGYIRGDGSEASVPEDPPAP